MIRNKIYMTLFYYKYVKMYKNLLILNFSLIYIKKLDQNFLIRNKINLYYFIHLNMDIQMYKKLNEKWEKINFSDLIII